MSCIIYHLQSNDLSLWWFWQLFECYSSYKIFNYSLQACKTLSPFLWCYNLENDLQQPHLGIVKDEQKVYDGKIVEHRGIGSQFPLPYTLRQINCGGLLLAPGLIDLQVQCAHCHKTSSIRTFLEFPNVKSKSRWHFMDNKHMLETVVTWLCSPP